MTKEQFIDKWENGYDSLGEDLDAVIANEIAKVQPEKTNKIEITPHTLVEVNRAFRALKQDRNSYIHKVFSDDGVFDAMEEIRQVHEAYFGSEERQIKPEDAQPQPELNPIEEAYERGEKIRKKTWEKDAWIKKHTEIMSMHDDACLRKKVWYNFDTYPNLWELYTEPIEQPEPKYPIGGYAPGHYTCICVNCKEAFMGDKRAVQCEPCAVKTTRQPAEQPALNPIEEAYERGEKIRHKNWLNGDWIQKHKETKTINNYGHINSVNPFAFIQYPEQWELYKPTDQVTDQVQNAKPFDKDRFEAMFCAVVASGEYVGMEFEKTEEALEKLDAFYASKKGGANE